MFGVLRILLPAQLMASYRWSSVMTNRKFGRRVWALRMAGNPAVAPRERAAADCGTWFHSAETKI